MSVGSQLRYGLARLLMKSAGFAVVPDWVRHSFMSPTFKALTQEGYTKNAAFFGCVSAHAFSFPEPPLKIYDSDEDDAQVIPKHPLRQLIRMPNPLMGETELMIYTIVYLAIGGNAYWHKARPRPGGKVVELWPYHAGQVKPVPGGPTWVSGYEFDHGGGKTEPIPAEDIVHFKWPAPDPNQPWQAMPPLVAAAREVDTDNEATRYLFTLLKNDAVPRTVVKVPAERMLTEDEVRRVKAQWKERYGGDNRGDVAILEGGADVSRLSLDLEQLAFDALHHLSETRICAALRVPPVIAGLGDDPTYANSEQAYIRYTHGTLALLWRLVESEIERNLAPDFGGVVPRFDRMKVEALQENADGKSTRILNELKAGVRGLKEARRALGMQEDLAMDDVFVWSMAMLPQTQGSVIADASVPPAPPKPVITDVTPTPPALPAPPAADDQPAKATRTVPDTKAKQQAAKVGRALQRLRADVAKRMEQTVDGYFTQLADTVVERASKAWQPAVARKDLPPIEDLITAEDDGDLEIIARRYYAEIIAASWDTWNMALGTEIAFDLEDPAVAKALKQAGTRIKDIGETTRAEVQDLLSYGAEHGWTVGDLVRGTADRAGLRDLVEQTYQFRARAIARTELGTAQQIAGVERYTAAGLQNVLVLDGEGPNSDDICNQLNGTTQTLAWARANPLQHPNCVRAFAPAFEE